MTVCALSSSLHGASMTVSALRGSLDGAPMTISSLSGSLHGAAVSVSSLNGNHFDECDALFEDLNDKVRRDVMYSE
jgi:hypothetical protein